jgi:hypothetical protein
MTVIVLLGLATIVLAVVFASYAAQVCRPVHDIARALGASGADVRQIARRTRLPQDVVSMLLTDPGMPRQNVPAAAGTSRPVRHAAVRMEASGARRPGGSLPSSPTWSHGGRTIPSAPAHARMQSHATAAPDGRKARASRGTDVATA